MMSTITYVAAVPSEAWTSATGGPSLAVLARDALSAERRLGKGVNVEVERSRYALICQSIEDRVKASPSLIAGEDLGVVDWSDSRVVCLALPVGYLNALRHLGGIAQPALRLGTTFIAPEQMVDHIQGVRVLMSRDNQSLDEPTLALLTKRLSFIESAAKENRGVVEFQNSFCCHTPSIIPPRSYAYGARSEESFSPLDREAPIDLDLETAVRQRICSVIDSGGGAINLGGLPHTMITDLLREFCFKDSSSSAVVNASVVYDDGSQGPPIALRSLPERDVSPDETSGWASLRVGLISMRHLELDPQIDFAWFRNREASKSRTLGEADAACYELSLKQFAKSRDRGNLLIYLLQTGFQPAVVAFFRALVEELNVRGGAPELVVVPRYYSRGGHLVGEGSPWC